MADKPKKRRMIDLLRPVEILHELITEVLCNGIFREVRGAQRQRIWTLHRLIEFWDAIILRAPASLTQALHAAAAGTDHLLPQVPASPQAFFSRCRNLSWTFFHSVFTAFTAELEPRAKPRFAREHAAVFAGFQGIWVIDGSRLDKIAHRLKILWNERGVVLPGCLIALYDLGKGTVHHLGFDPDAARAEWNRAKEALLKVPNDVLVLGDRLYGTAQFFAVLAAQKAFGLVRRNKRLGLRTIKSQSKRRWEGGWLEDFLVDAGSGQGVPTQRLRLIRWKKGKKVYELLTNVLEPTRLPAAEAIRLYRARWTVERLFLALKSVLNLHCFHAANTNAVAMQVYAAAIVYNALRFAQGEAADQARIAPEEISEAKLFPRVVAASALGSGAEIGVQTVIDMNPGLRLKRPDMHTMPFAKVPLDDVRVQKRNAHRRKRRFCKARARWKSMPGVKRRED